MNAQHISEEDLVLYSMQSLSAGETATVELHLEECAECGRQLAEVAGDLALLSLSVDQQPVPAGARDRFMSRVATETQTKAISAPTVTPPIAIAKGEPKNTPEPRRVIQEVKPRRNWFPILIPWAAAFAMLALAGYLGSRNQKLDDLLNDDKGQIAQLSAKAARAEEVMETLTSPSAKQVTLTEGKGAPPPQAYTASGGPMQDPAGHLLVNEAI